LPYSCQTLRANAFALARLLCQRLSVQWRVMRSRLSIAPHLLSKQELNYLMGIAAKQDILCCAIVVPDSVRSAVLVCNPSIAGNMHTQFVVAVLLPEQGV
jgi:hypothetical protein